MADDMAGLDPELVRFLREELAVDVAGSRQWQVSAPLWIWRPKGKDAAATSAWHFITITGPAADGLRAAAPGRSAAWGSVYVTVRLGDIEWQTSAFPSKDVGGYLLPMKAAVRKKAGVAEGDMVTVTVSV
ncbi:MAG: DUF1905 domain-containing protein [Sphingomonadales bacterium]|jgi:hypothetical protein